jgi:glycine cleavage system transcriptional repressor
MVDGRWFRSPAEDKPASAGRALGLSPINDQPARAIPDIVPGIGVLANGSLLSEVSDTRRGQRVPAEIKGSAHMEQWVAVTAVGRDRPGIVAGVTEALLQLGCNLAETSMTRLRSEFAMILLVRLPAGGTAEDARRVLAPVGEGLDLTVTVRTLAAAEAQAPEDQGAAYILRVYGADRPGIVHQITALLARIGLNITDLETRVIPGEGGPVYVMVLELDAASEEQGEAARATLQALAASIPVEISYDRLDEERL